MADEVRSGIKVLTLANWTEPDPANEHFVRWSPVLRGMVPMDKGDWARLFLGINLADHVPPEIRELFDVARGTILYGWFFYPLFQLGQEQLFRVSEAAAKHCYQTHGGPKSRPTFQQSVEFLVSKNVIGAANRRTWDAARELRNAASHPERLSVMPPGAIASMIETTAIDINALFGVAAPIGLVQRHLADGQSGSGAP